EERPARTFCAPCAPGPRRIKHTKLADPSFPLTPALSPRERENRSLAIGLSAALALVERRDTWLPLPKGEGRGEGEGRVRSRGVEASKVGFMGRVGVRGNGSCASRMYRNFFVAVLVLIASLCSHLAREGRLGGSANMS